MLEVVETETAQHDRNMERERGKRRGNPRRRETRGGEAVIEVLILSVP